MAIIDVGRLEAKAREHSDNKRIVRRDDLKISLVSVRPGEEIPTHLHEGGEQFYYVPEGEGVLSHDSEIYWLRPWVAVVIPPHLPVAFRTPVLLPCDILTFLWLQALDLCPTQGSHGKGDRDGRRCNLW